MSLKLNLKAFAVSIFALTGLAFSSPLDANWAEYDAAMSKSLYRTATNVLVGIEKEAEELQLWPDLAAATLFREHLEYTFTEENALDAETSSGLVMKMAERFEKSRPEIRPMLRLALVHDYLQLYSESRWNAIARTKLADSTNGPPWSAENITPSVLSLLEKIEKDSDLFKSQNVSDWARLLRLPDSYAISCRPTLWDFAVYDIADMTPNVHDAESIVGGTARKWIEELAGIHSSEERIDARCYALFRKLELDGGDKRAFAEKWFDISQVSAEVAWLAAGSTASSSDKPGASNRVDAIAFAEKFVRRWPDSAGAKNCTVLIERLKRPDFSLSAENHLLENDEEIIVSYKNLTNINFRIVPLKFSDFAERASFEVERREYDLCFSNKPAAEWSVALDDGGDHMMRRTKLKMPRLAPGYYNIYASVNDEFGRDGLPCMAIRVARTDLYLQSSSDSTALKGAVLHSLTGFPQEGVSVEFWKFDGNKYFLDKTVKTDSRGLFSIPLANDWKSRQGFLRAVNGSDGTLPLRNYGVTTLESVGTGICRRLITDRSVYRPGQKVKFKGYAGRVDSKSGKYSVIPGDTFTVDFFDFNRKKIASGKFTSNDFGTFSGEFEIPENHVTGNYFLEIAGGNDAMAVVKVEEYKRPKFNAGISKAEGLRFDSETRLTGSAKTYSGLPVAGAKVAWEVTRRKQYPYWCWWIGGVRDDGAKVVASGEVETDENGEFTFAFTAVADNDNAGPGEDPVYYYSCKASVRDDTGEMHTALRQIPMRKVPCVATLTLLSSGWCTTADGVRFSLDLRRPDGTPFPDVKGIISVYSLEQPDSPIRGRIAGEGYNPDDETDILRDIFRWKKKEVVKTVEVLSNEGGMAGGGFPIPAGPYRLVYSAQLPEGEVRAEALVRVIDPSSARHSVMEPSFVAVEKPALSVGDTARLYFGSGYSNVYCRVRVIRNGEVLADEIRKEPCFVYEYKVEEAHRGGFEFETSFVRNNRSYYYKSFVNVPWDRHILKIHREHMNSKLLPDGRETWKFRVTGLDTNEVRSGVEALAMMFDRSLDSIVPYSPSLYFADSFLSRRLYSYTGSPNHRPHFGKVHGEWPALPDGWVIFWGDWRRFGYLDGSFSPFNDSIAGYILEKMPNARRAGRFRGEKTLGYAAEAVDGEEILAEGNAALAASVPIAPLAKPKLKAGPVEDDTADIPIRSNLEETAFFIPFIHTDEKGVLEFSFTSPQALTGWNLFILAHDRTLATGSFIDKTIVTQKPLMTEPSAPRFVREGDSFLFPVKVTNTGDAAEKGRVTLEFEDVSTSMPVSVCRKKSETGEERTEDSATFDFELAAGESRIFEFPVRIHEGCPYLKYTAKAVGENFTDGEESILPVLARKILVRESISMQIKRPGEKHYRFDSLAGSARSATIRHIGLTAQAVGDPSWYAFAALPYLMEYPHECNEQIFSRFYANAIAARIANSDPGYRKMFEAWEEAGADVLKSPLEQNDSLKSIALEATPWVREAASETAARRHIGELFGSARLESEQQKALNRLVQNACPNGGWAWFPGGAESEYVTMYILTGVARLRHLGVDVDGLSPEFCRIEREARASLDAHMEDYARLASKDALVHEFQVRWLYLQSFDCSWNEKYSENLIRRLLKERNWARFDNDIQSMASLVLWRYGEKETAKTVLQSLKERAVRSEERGLYWKRPGNFGTSLYSAPVSAQALAMEAFQEITPEDADAYEEARQWLLEQKRTQNWSTTVSTADAVYAILLGRGKGAPRKTGPVTILLGTQEVPKNNVEEGSFFYEHRYYQDQIKPEMGDITISRKESALGWASLCWTYLEDVDKVEAYSDKALRIKKEYFKKTRVDGKVRLVAITGGEKLLPGDELVSRLAIDSDRVLDYVHIKDERPASAEPADILSSYRRQDGLHYYQSTRDTATHYYLERLPRGNFVLETSYYVRQKGIFASGLATAECMYAPEFGAHSAASVVKVAE